MNKTTNKNFINILFILTLLLLYCGCSSPDNIEVPDYDKLTSYLSTKKIDSSKIKKILFLGNSICIVPIGKEGEGFPGGWGMYASTAEKDYCHIVYKLYTNDSSYKNMVQINIWDFEKNRTNWDGVDSWTKTSIYEVYQNFCPDIIIIQVGDNAASTYNIEYERSYEKLITSFGDTPIICVSTILQNEALTINLAMRDICRKNDISFIDCWDILSDNRNTTLISGIPNCHPNDSGMEKIANRIYNELK